MAETPSKPVAVAAPSKPVSVAAVAPGKDAAATGAVAAAPAKPAEAAEKKERKARTNESANKKIFIVEAAVRAKMPEGRTDLNPKREGTKGYKAFSLYKNGQTVAEFLKLASETKHTDGESVGSMADIRWDKEHGFIELKD